MTSYCVLICLPYLYSVQNEYTALMVAAQNGHLRIVELLISAKADVNIQSNVSQYNDPEVHTFVISVRFEVRIQLEDIQCRFEFEIEF